ncbi:leucine-rich repeat, immunoglobulin-like domain and transmembrane domain-containing protein 3b [Eucyclogobius newberryi]|uniref:leucine-rich repeat, immunoglobulin-like domain and transmembrane domain-containing protein 3b n=1 Tax=Eucyclogobius newberryi TaxID=166745 RepID=UPI003B5B8710
MPVLWVLPLWVLPLLLCSEPRVDACPPLCTCSSAQATEEPRSVLCRDPEILTVPTNVPVNTVKLRLEKTQISRLSRAAFYNLSDLRFLWVTYSALRSVHPSSFVNLKTLRELRLGGNHLTAFPWEGLRDTPRLQILDLHNNLVSSLPAHAALFLANVTYLDLSSNRLTLLPAELLDLWFPLPEQQQTTVQTRVLGLHDNPWLCDCQISLVTSLSVSLDSPVVLLDPALICIRSVGQGGVLLMPVWWQRCVRPSVQPAATRVVSPVGSNVILRCEATGYPTPTLSWVKAVAYTDCCQQDIPQDDDQLPKNLQSVMQGSPRVGVRWSIISLNGLSYKDAGEYRCRARNMAGTSEAPIKLRITGSSRTRGPPKQPTSTKATSNKATSNTTAKATSTKATSTKATSNKATSNKATSNTTAKATSTKATSTKATSNKATSNKATSNTTAKTTSNTTAKTTSNTTAKTKSNTTAKATSNTTAKATSTKAKSNTTTKATSNTTTKTKSNTTAKATSNTTAKATSTKTTSNTTTKATSNTTAKATSTKAKSNTTTKTTSTKTTSNTTATNVQQKTKPGSSFYTYIRRNASKLHSAEQDFELFRRV